MLYIKTPTKDSNYKLTILKRITYWIHRKCTYSLRNVNIRIYYNQVLARLNFWHQIVLSLSKNTPMSYNILEIVPQGLFSGKGRIAFIAFGSYQLKTEGSHYCSHIDGKESFFK